MATRIPTSISEEVKTRFWSKVDRCGADECWPWTGPLYEGYGHFYFHHGLGMKAHRAAQFILGNPPQGRECVDHVCRNRCCVNPAHLRNVSIGTNSRENSVGPTALNALKTHCIHGHEFTPENTRIRSGTVGWRGCKTCAEARKRSARLRSRNPSGEVK